MMENDALDAEVVRLDRNADLDARGVKFRLIRFDEIKLSTSALALVKGILPAHSTGVMWGPYGTCKSFLATDIGMAIARGLNWRDKPTKGGPVVYCYFEGAAGFSQRAEAYRQAHMPEEADPVPFYWQPLTLDLVAEHGKLIEDIAAQEIQPALVIIDTLARSMRGDENSNRDMGEYFNAADSIRQAFGCTVLIVHHSGYDDSHSRGATALPSNADFEIKVSRSGDEIVVAEVRKYKDGATGEKIASRIEVIEIGVDDDGDPITSLALREAEVPESATGSRVRLNPNQQTMLTILQEAMPEGLTTEEWNAAAREAGMEKTAKQRLYDWRIALKNKRLVHEFADRWFVSHG